MKGNSSFSLPALACLLMLTAPADAQERITFPSADGDLRGGTPTTLTSFLYKPQRAGPFAAVVLLHGCDGLVGEDGKVRTLYGSWGAILAREGYVVVLPDSHGSRGHKNLCQNVPPPVQANRERPRDAYGSLAYLRSRSDVRGKEIAIFGQSGGAASLFFTIAEDARPKELSPQLDFRAAVAFYPPCQFFIAREPRWAPRMPLLFLMGEADNWTPPAPCKELLSQIPANAHVPIEPHYYAGAYHAFDHPNLPEQVITAVKLPSGQSPKVGTNPKARADAIRQVKQFLAVRLK